jgi:hypothetical protein
MIRGEEQEVLVDNTIILQGIQLREHIEVPVHPLLGRIRKFPEWMSYKGK